MTDELKKALAEFNAWTASLRPVLTEEAARSALVHGDNYDMMGHLVEVYGTDRIKAVWKQLEGMRPSWARRQATRH